MARDIRVYPSTDIVSTSLMWGVWAGTLLVCLDCYKTGIIGRSRFFMAVAAAVAVDCAPLPVILNVRASPDMVVLAELYGLGVVMLIRLIAGSILCLYHKKQFRRVRDEMGGSPQSPYVETKFTVVALITASLVVLFAGYLYLK